MNYIIKQNLKLCAGLIKECWTFFRFHHVYLLCFCCAMFVLKPILKSPNISKHFLRCMYY